MKSSSVSTLPFFSTLVFATSSAENSTTSDSSENPKTSGLNFDTSEQSFQLFTTHYSTSIKSSNVVKTASQTEFIVEPIITSSFNSQPGSNRFTASNAKTASIDSSSPIFVVNSHSIQHSSEHNTVTSVTGNDQPKQTINSQHDAISLSVAKK